MTGRREVRSIWAVRVRAELTADVVDRLEQELAIDFFALAKPHEVVVGQRTIQRDDHGTVILLIERDRDDAEFSFRLLSAVASEAAASYSSLRRACERVAADLGERRGLAVVALANEEGGLVGEDVDLAPALIALAAIRAETSVRLAEVHADLNGELSVSEIANRSSDSDGPSRDETLMPYWAGGPSAMRLMPALLSLLLVAMSYLMTQLLPLDESPLTSAIVGATGFGAAAAVGSLLGRILRLRGERAPYVDRVEQLALVVLVTTSVLLPLAGGLPPTAEAQVLLVTYLTLVCLTMSFTYLLYLRLHQPTSFQGPTEPADGQPASTSVSDRSATLRRSVAAAERIIATAHVDAVEYFESEVDRRTLRHVALMESFDIVPPAWLLAAQTEIADRDAPQEEAGRKALPSGEPTESPADQ